MTETLHRMKPGPVSVEWPAASWSGPGFSRPRPRVACSSTSPSRLPASLVPCFMAQTCPCGQANRRRPVLQSRGRPRVRSHVASAMVQSPSPEGHHWPLSSGDRVETACLGPWSSSEGPSSSSLLRERGICTHSLVLWCCALLADLLFQVRNCSPLYEVQPVGSHL